MPNPLVEYLQEQMIDRQQQREQYARLNSLGALNPVSIGKLNTNLVLDYIYRKGPISRAEIARQLDLSRGTVSDIIDFFKKKGFVEEGDSQPATSKGGRPASEIKLKADTAYIISVDIGRSHLAMLLTDLNARRPINDQNTRGPESGFPWMVAQETHTTDSRQLFFEGFETGKGAEICLPDIAKKLQKLVETNNLKWEDILGIGVGLPGTLDRNRERLTRAMMMPKWNDINIPIMLRHLLRIPGPFPIPIRLDNDANLGVLGECRYGAGRKRRLSNALYVKAGMGVGAGLILNGEVYRGHGGSAGEFGHQIVDPSPSGLECNGCGNHGCLESFVAERAIVQHAKLTNDSDASITRVVQLAQEGNRQCRSALQQAGKLMGLAIANFIDLINPELILLDGSVVRDSGELFMNSLLASAESCIPAAKGNADIRKGDLGKYAILYGAIASVIDEAFPNFR